MHPSLPRPSPRVLGTTVRAPDPDIATQLGYLVRSAEPAVVFASLAHLCVPIVSDACIIDIVELATVGEETHLEQPRRGHDTVEQLHAARAHRSPPPTSRLSHRGVVRGTR